MQVAHDLAHDAQRVRVVVCQMVGDARDARVHVGAAEVLGRDFLAGRRLHERRTARKIVPLPLTITVSSPHRGTYAPPPCTIPLRGDLRNALARHARLVVEDASEVVAIREDLSCSGKNAPPESTR